MNKCGAPKLFTWINAIIALPTLALGTMQLVLGVESPIYKDISLPDSPILDRNLRFSGDGNWTWSNNDQVHQKINEFSRTGLYFLDLRHSWWTWEIIINPFGRFTFSSPADL